MYIAIIAIIVFFITFELKFYFYESESPLKKMASNSNIFKRVLVIAPHPDDETLGSGGLIQDALKSGGKVKIIVMTNGDAFKLAVEKNFNTSNPVPHDYLKLGYMRQNETINALLYLGVKRSDITFLGYPDRGLAHLWSYYWDKPYISHGPKVAHSPYDNSFNKNVQYEGKNVVYDLTKIIKEYKPTLLVYPHPNEVHPDHWGANCFVNYSLFTLNKNYLPQYLYIIHRSDWPLPFGKHPELNLNPPTNLLNTGTDWRLFPLTMQEINKKGIALLKYRTQAKVMKSFLLAFDRKTELFGYYPDGTIKEYKGGKLNGYKVIIDPMRDNVRDYENSAADITNVYAYVKNNKLNIYIGCRQKANPIYEYSFYAIFFKKNKEIGRDFMHVISGKMDIKNHGFASIKNGIVNLKISLNKNKDFDYIYMAVDSMSNGKLIDKSAWHMLKRVY